MRCKTFLAVIAALCAALLIFLPIIPCKAGGILPLDTYTGGEAPKDAFYLSDTQYRDPSISAEIFTGRFADTDYTYARVRIKDPSQLRTAPAAIGNSPTATFRSTSTARGRLVAKAVDAVIAMNGDYFTKSDKCQVVMRQTHQLRNSARGNMDVLIIDKSGNFDAIKKCTRAMYQEYYDTHAENMYNVFCFGPVLVENGLCVIPEDYSNGYVGARNRTQRSAIAQLGELDYLLVTSAGPQSEGSKGMTIAELARLTESLGYEFTQTGCRLAFNLDGGNSSTLVFKQPSDKGDGLVYKKVNSPEIERFLSDIIYFSTLESHD